MSLNSEQSPQKDPVLPAGSLEATLERVLAELQRLDCLRDQLDSTSQLLSDTQAELAQARAVVAMDNGAIVNGAIVNGAVPPEILEELHYWQQKYSDLLEERDRTEEENVRLIAELSVARSSHPLGVLGAGKSPESMTWEQRKAAILEQLSREDAAESVTAQESIDIRKELESLASQLTSRDSELARLRLEHAELLSSLEDPLRGSGGITKKVEFGRLIEADQLIADERRKLQAVRQEWEEKLRRAEVELSLERAKLTRDRRALEQRTDELEAKLEKFQSLQSDQRLKANESDEPKRRWLKHLGLGEGN